MYMVAPVAAVFFMFATFANLGLPGLAGFIAEFFTFAGTLSVFPKFVYAGILGIVIIAAFSLWMIQRVLLGQPDKKYKDLPDISPREVTAMVPLMAITLLLGILPSVLISIIDTPLGVLATRLIGGGM
jgi:NADH-quinone oxidoreductase subunit M